MLNVAEITVPTAGERFALPISTAYENRTE